MHVPDTDGKKTMTVLHSYDRDIGIHGTLSSSVLTLFISFVTYLTTCVKERLESKSIYKYMSDGSETATTA